MSKQIQEKIRVHCNNCNQETAHFIIAKDEDKETEEFWHGALLIEVWTLHISQIIKCNGCGEKSLRKSIIWSEDIPDHPEKEIVFFPKRGTSSIPLPKTFSRHVPKSILLIYSEIVDAFNNQINLLCAGGIRAIIEAICKNKGVNVGKTSRGIKNNLEGKINGLVDMGYITITHGAILHEHRYLGNEALHEMKSPKSKELRIAIEIIAHTLSSIYEISSKGEELKRRKRKKVTNKP